MLKVAATRQDTPDRRVFHVVEDGNPAPTDTLARVVLVAVRLLGENELPGTFRVWGEGAISLELPASDRSYFHDGILFAALDVFNDPARNPTLFRFSLDGE